MSADHHDKDLASNPILDGNASSSSIRITTGRPSPDDLPDATSASARSKMAIDSLMHESRNPGPFENRSAIDVDIKAAALMLRAKDAIAVVLPWPGCPNRIAEFIPGAEKYAEIIGLYEVTEQNCELYFDMQTKHLKIYL